MFSLPIGAYLAWVGLISYYFTLFWLYLPFALAARELNQVHARYA